MTPQPFDFSAASAIDQIAVDRWAASFVTGWDLGGIPNGGYQLAVATRVALAATGHPDPLSMHGVYLHKANNGPVEAVTTMLKTGERQAALHVSLIQNDTIVTEVTALVGSLETATKQLLWGNAVPPDLPEPDACTRLVHTPPGLFPPPIVNEVDVRLHPDDYDQIGERASGSPQFRGWVRYKDQHEMNAIRTMVAADVFPPPILNSGIPLGWVPTMTLTVQMRKRPTTAWLAGRFETTVTNGPYLAENGELWDEAGELVATVQQLAALPRR